jgi:C_GCAxxG_C_C family probable redox protein
MPAARAIIVLMPDKAQMAVDKFAEGYNCAQSVVFAFCEECGLSQDAALKISCGFGAGMGRKQEVCGAVTGGVMVLGLRHGRGAADRRSVTEALYPMTREFMDGFAARNSSYLCRDLLSGCDLTSEEGQRYFKEHGLLEKVCKPCVRSAAKILQQMA